LTILLEVLLILGDATVAWSVRWALGAAAFRTTRAAGVAAVFLCTLEIRERTVAGRWVLFSAVWTALAARCVRTGATFLECVRTTLVTWWVRTAVTFLATVLTGEDLALVLILIRWTGARLVSFVFALMAVLDPTTERVFWVSLPTELPEGDGLVSAYEEVAAKASPRTTPAVATRILSSQRAVVAPATPV
jgi:hypothetical protein